MLPNISIASIIAAAATLIPCVLASAQTGTQFLVCKTPPSEGWWTSTIAIDLASSKARLGNVEVPVVITDTQYRFRLSPAQSGIPEPLEIQIDRLTGDYYRHYPASRKTERGSCTKADRL